MSEKIKVYYNSACPVCKAGIEGQQCLLENVPEANIEWLDVHANPELAKEVGADLERVRERLHVKTSDGAVRVGTDAFAALFERTPGQHWRGSVLRLPIVRQLSQLFYAAFARVLYLWNRANRRW